MEASHDKAAGLQQTLQIGPLEVLGNALDAAGELVLSDLVDGVEVIDPLDLVDVALAHRVDADPAWVALWEHLAADAERRGVPHLGCRSPSRMSASGAGCTGGRWRSSQGARDGRPRRFGSRAATGPSRPV